MRSCLRSGGGFGSRAAPLPLVAVAFLLLVPTPALAPRPAAAADKVYELKFGSIAPDGTAFTDPLHEFKETVEKQSGGRVKMKLYLGSVGDEKDIIRKMKLDQLNAAGVTGIGLAQILPEIHVLDLPMLFESYDEVDYVYPRILGHFQKAFDEKGFVFLGFTEAGFAYLFSKKRIETLEDLQKSARVWAWEGDPLVKALMDQAKISAVSIPFTDVVMALQTGLLDTIYAPPFAAIALQWFLHVKYMSEVPLVHGTGGVIISKKSWLEQPEDLRKLSEESFKVLATKLVASTRKDNETARKELIEKRGIQVIPKPKPEVWSQYLELARQTRESQVGKLYSRELLDEVLKLRDEARAQKAAGAAVSGAPAIPAPAK